MGEDLGQAVSNAFYTGYGASLWTPASRTYGGEGVMSIVMKC